MARKASTWFTGDSDRNLVGSMITIEGSLLQIPNIHDLKTSALLYEGLNPHFSGRNSFLLYLNFRLHTGPFISEGKIAHGGSGIGRLLYVDDRGRLAVHSISMCDLVQKSLHGDLMTDATSLPHDLNMDDFRFLQPNVKGEGREDANRKWFPNSKFSNPLCLLSFFAHIYTSLCGREFWERKYVPSFRVKLKASGHSGALTLPFPLPSLGGLLEVAAR